MKTKNNVQETILKSVAVITSLVLISLTVNAQYHWKSLLEKYNLNEFELALLDNTVETIEKADANVYAFLLEQESDETLELEGWMTEENYLSSYSAIQEAVEAPLNVEDWMINEALFTANSVYTMAVTEEPLEIENWMLDENCFEGSVYKVIEETETEAKIEGWMLDENFFEGVKETEQSLKLEAWMISEEVW